MKDDYPRFGPKKDDHMSVGAQCPVCRKPFAPGDYTTLEAMPPEDEESIARMKAGLTYNAPAMEVHWECRGKYQP